MAAEILMPKLGMIMTEGQVTRWAKQPGEAVRRGEVILEVTTEKINYEVEAGADGILHPVVPEGEVVPIGAVVGFLLAAGEAPPAIIPPPRPVEVTDPEAPRSGPAAATTAESSPSPAGPGGEVRASPAARRLARDVGVDIVAIAGSGPGGRIVEADVLAAASAVAGVKSSPLARRLAREHQVALDLLTGTGLGGRITEKDVLAAESRPAAPDTVPAFPAVPARPTREIRPLTGMRRVIADRMQASLQNSAQLTLHTEADVTDLAARRQAFRADEAGNRVRVTTSDLILKACAEALRRHWRANAAIVGNEIHYLEDIDIGFAVALEDGLIVPIVRHADRKSIVEIARETADLAGRARSGRLKPDEVSGGTFTVSVLGMVDAFTPIINPPESAILGVGRIVEKPAVHMGTIEIRSLMALSLTIDHRVIDGEPGARLLRRIRQYLEAPDRLFSPASVPSA